MVNFGSSMKEEYETSCESLKQENEILRMALCEAVKDIIGEIKPRIINIEAGVNLYISIAERNAHCKSDWKRSED